MHLTHEEKVERFYSHGAGIRSAQGNGFLSFGYWDNNTSDYDRAVINLLQRVLEHESPLHGDCILNVACGYGAETLVIFKKLLPDKIIAIDITGAHIDYARRMAENKCLSEKICFEKMDACSIPFNNESFRYVIGIEGPAHFNSREEFLRKGYNVLKRDGVLLLTDIIVDDIAARKNWIRMQLSRFCSRQWHMPETNWMTIGELRNILENIGYKKISIKSIGEYVYPGFAKFNTRWSSIVNAVKIRGFYIGIGLTVISWLLGFTYRLGLVDYVIIKAIKE